MFYFGFRQEETVSIVCHMLHPALSAVGLVEELVNTIDTGTGVSCVLEFVPVPIGPDGRLEISINHKTLSICTNGSFLRYLRVGLKGDIQQPRHLLRCFGP